MRKVKVSKYCKYEALMKQIIVAGCLFLWFVGCGSVNRQILRNEEIKQKKEKQEEFWNNLDIDIALKEGELNKYKKIENELCAKEIELEREALLTNNPISKRNINLEINDIEEKRIQNRLLLNKAITNYNEAVNERHKKNRDIVEEYYKKIGAKKNGT